MNEDRCPMSACGAEMAWISIAEMVGGGFYRCERGHEWRRTQTGWVAVD